MQCPNTVAGCVPIAIAQIMKFHMHPSANTHHMNWGLPFAQGNGWYADNTYPSGSNYSLNRQNIFIDH